MSEQETPNLREQGINGWLIVVAIGIVLTPFLIIYIIVTNYPVVFKSGVWQAITTPGSAQYVPFLGTLIIIEMVVYSLFLIINLYVAYLFFSKKASMPKWYITLSVASFVFVLLDSWAVSLIFPNKVIFDKQMIKDLVVSAIGVIIWVPYMLVSKRVKAVFIN